MALYDNPPFSVTILVPSSSTDQGGGVVLTYATRTANVKGILNSATSSERAMLAQQGLTVSHTFVQYGTTTAQRGDVLDYGGRKLRVVGINVNDAMGNIPTLSKLMLDEILG